MNTFQELAAEFERAAGFNYTDDQAAALHVDAICARAGEAAIRAGLIQYDGPRRGMMDAKRDAIMRYGWYSLLQAENGASAGLYEIADGHARRDVRLWRRLATDSARLCRRLCGEPNEWLPAYALAPVKPDTLRQAARAGRVRVEKRGGKNYYNAADCLRLWPGELSRLA